MIVKEFQPLNKSDEGGELINLYHLARTALSGEPCGRYERMLWACKQWDKLHPGEYMRAYKSLDRVLT